MAAKTITASSSGWKYAVFLSFRGEDTRNNFTGHLYKALDQKGIDTFLDDKKLRRGEEISPTLITAIRRSRCSIIVLSENYASSKWCLEELVEILLCKRTKNQRVVPIFYNVDPSHVRNQTGSFGEALAEHEKNEKIKKEKVQKWREALTQVANLSGFHSLNKSEAQLIEEIILDVCKDLDYVPSKDTQFLVGVDSCIRELELLLCLESIDVRMVGIWGMGGIGKTTLARAIYERISHKFEGSCFLANVGGLARKGEDYLKKQLLSRVLRDKNIDATTTSLKTRLHSKKVLIVIDNVNHRSILKTLVGEANWFGAESRIIITTRDKHFLTMHGVSVVYEVQKLQDDKAIKVFNYYAFRNDPPSRDVMNLIDHVIAYAQGLPLALEVLGSSLCKKSKDEWMCALNKLKKIPNREIHEVLQLSFDELDDDEKSIFLDIACAFVGEEKDGVVEVLDSCSFSATSGIRTLIDKSLIIIIDGDLHMHDLLVEMGKEIVRRTFPNEPEKRSRLWTQQDICHVLDKHMGTKDIEIMALNLSGLKEIRFTTTAFAKMTKLRVLIISSESSPHKILCKVHIADDFKFYYDELRFLFWEHYPLKSLPYDFESKNLLWMLIWDSHLTQLWEGNKVFENLKYISLKDSKYLRETPDLSGVTNLKLLNFRGCTQLCKIHPSIGYLDKLIELSFEDCINLKHIPGIDHLVSLEILVLSGCSKLEKFPDISQPMPCLSELYLDGTAITELPASIGYAAQLVLLTLENCKNLKLFPCIDQLASLETLILCCCTKLEKFPDIYRHMPCLSKLYLDETAITELPSSICYATQLTLLSLESCKKLKRFSDISQLVSLEALSLSDCSNLEKFLDISQHIPCLSQLYLDGTAMTELPSSISYATQLVRLSLENCIKLKRFPSIDQLASLENLNLSGCSKLEKFPDISQPMPCLSKLYLDGTAITDLPSSIAYATQLDLLSLKNCKNLQCFPAIDQLASLETLILSGCSKLEKFPDISQPMPCLLKLYLDGTAITELPFSIGYATQLVLLSLKNCINLNYFPGIDQLVSLETLILSGCSNLEMFPDISRCMSCFSELYLDGTAITELPSSIGHATQLALLSLENCIHFRRFPDIDQLASLETLNLSGCSKLEKFLDISQHMPCLVKLYLDGTSITDFPSSTGSTRLVRLSLKNCIHLKHFPGIGQFVSLEKLSLSGCSNLEKFLDNSQHMPCLSELYLDGTAVTELPSIAFATQLVQLVLTECRNLQNLPTSICKLTCLEILSLSGCSNLDALPRTLERLCSLRRLELQNCISLSALPALPSSLELVNASNCPLLEHISPQSVLFFGGSIFANCIRLREYPNTMKHDILNMATHADKERWRSTYDQLCSNVQVPFSTVFPGSRIPNWFKHRRKGHTVHLKASPNWYSSNFLGFAVSAVVKIGDGSPTYCNLDSHERNSKSVSNHICSFTDDHTCELEDTRDDHLWLSYIPSVFGFNCEKWSRIKFTFHTDTWNSNNVKRCGICPVYIKSSSDEECCSSDGSYSSSDDQYDSDGNYSSSDDSDDGNPGGSVLDDLHEDNTIIRSLDDAEPRGIGCFLTQNPEELVPAGVGQPESQEIGCFLTDSRTRYQERVHFPWMLHFRPMLYLMLHFAWMLPWVLITIFAFLFLAHIFLRALCWILPLVASPFRISRLVASLLPSPYGISTLLCFVVLLLFILSRL